MSDVDIHAVPEASSIVSFILADGGEMGARMRAIDWSTTSLGPPETWPRSLHIVLHVVLTSRHPMFLWWGPNLIQFCNDGYLPSLGSDRHRTVLGSHGREFWGDIWPIIGPEVESVMQGGASTWHVDHLVPITRNARVEEVYWTYSYSPVLDDHGRIGGTLVTVQETTLRVLTERRMTTLRTLVERTAAGGRSVADVCSIVADVLGKNDADISFALLYLREDDGQTLRLMIATRNLPRHAFLDIVDVSETGLNESGWPLAGVARSGRAELIEDVRTRFGDLPGGQWSEPSNSAIVLPIVSASNAQPSGVLVAGISPRVEFDERYRAFLELIANQIAGAVANACSYESERAAMNAAEFERARLRELFDQAPAAICLLSGPEHVYTFTNPRYLELIGRQDLLTKSVREVFPELEGQGVLEMLDSVYLTGQAVVGKELLMQLDRDEDGQPEDVYFTFVYAPFLGTDGVPEGIFVHAYEVTDQVRARHEAESAVRARDEFLSIAAHELRTPVTSIKGAAQLLQRAAMRGALDDARIERNLGSIVSQANRLVSLIVDLLDVSRIQGGQLALRPRELDLAALVREAVTVCREGLEGEHHSISVEGASEPCLMAGDPDRLEQILANLLDNAVKYSPDGGAIAVRLEYDAETVSVSIADRGIGLPDDMTEQIFEPFGRSPDAYKRNIPGMGLGLHISRQIAERHGGTLSARSSGTDRGTTFLLRLPRWTTEDLN